LAAKTINKIGEGILTIAAAPVLRDLNASQESDHSHSVPTSAHQRRGIVIGSVNVKAVARRSWV